MSVVDLNEQTTVIEVKSNNETNSTIIAKGNFAVDRPSRLALVSFNHIQIPPDNHQELDQFISLVVAHVGSLYTSFVLLRLPAIFDGRIDLDQLKSKTKDSTFMVVILDHLKYFPENNLQEEYQLIANKESILIYAEEIMTMMRREAFWATNWSLDETKNLINSATHTVMILDRMKNRPCGFGRLFLLKTNEELFGYVSDMAIDSSHHLKGLGGILMNNFVSICVSQDIKQKGITGTLCLQCSDRGSGTISAPKLYRKFGFEYLKDIDNRIAFFANTEYYV